MENIAEIILPIMGLKNEKKIIIARKLRLIGIFTLIAIVFLLEIGTLRTILLLFSLLMMSLPFTLRFFIDEHKKIGLLKLTKKDIIIKYVKQNPILFPIKNLHYLTFKIIDFEGETKMIDMANSAGRLNMRLGNNNTLEFKTKGKENYLINFKLNSSKQKKKAVNFFKSYQAQILIINI